MLELYHNVNSVCAQKVRIALKEKGQEAQEHLLTLRGDQNEPDYLKLNPNGVVYPRSCMTELRSSNPHSFSTISTRFFPTRR